jgi:hypothetical protein
MDSGAHFLVPVDDKTIQAILRHSNVAVTQACYIQSLPEHSIKNLLPKRIPTTPTQKPVSLTGVI